MDGDVLSLTCRLVDLAYIMLWMYVRCTSEYMKGEKSAHESEVNLHSWMLERLYCTWNRARGRPT